MLHKHFCNMRTKSLKLQPKLTRSIIVSTGTSPPEMMVSHFTWRADDEIMVFCRHNGKDAYYIIEDKEGAAFKMVEEQHLYVDGHPTFLKNNDMIFVSDTYPDNGRRRHLFIYNIETNTYSKSASLKAPIKYDGPSRCDLHPRLNPTCKCVCVDSIHEGYRGMYEIEI